MNARVLVIDGNTAEIRARQVAALGYDSGTGYQRVLQQIDPSLHVDIVLGADAQPQFPAGVGLKDYDGVTMTGSALNIYHGGPAVTRQIELTKSVFAAGIPFFGSCWGLQVAVTAAGGTVCANPRGREFGVARDIVLTEAGRAHPMFTGKPVKFDALTVHRDYIARLPEGAAVLGANEFGLQAAAFTCGRAPIWGVQYHPEYAYVDIAAAAERYGDTLVTEGLFYDAPALAEYASDLRSLQARPQDGGLLDKRRVSDTISDPSLRHCEIRNWLKVQVHRSPKAVTPAAGVGFVSRF